VINDPKISSAVESDGEKRKKKDGENKKCDISGPDD